MHQTGRTRDGSWLSGTSTPEEARGEANVPYVFQSSSPDPSFVILPLHVGLKTSITSDFCIYGPNCCIFDMVEECTELKALYRAVRPIACPKINSTICQSSSQDMGVFCAPKGPWM